MKRMKAIVVISALCSLMWMSAVFAGDTVNLTVTTGNASIKGKWDDLSGLGVDWRFIENWKTPSSGRGQRPLGFA